MVKTFKTFDACIKEVRRDMVKAGAITLNQTAYEAMQNQKILLRKNFVLRNTFTEKSSHYTSCPRSENIADLKAVAGFLNRVPYMERQEKGGVHRPKSGSHHVPIAATSARSGKSNAKPIAKKYRFPLKVSHVSGENESFRGKMVKYAYLAFKEKGTIIYTTKNKFRGIFEVKNFTRQNKKVHFDMNLIYNLNNDSTTTKPAPVVMPAAEKAAEKMQEKFNQNMAMQ